MESSFSFHRIIAALCIFVFLGTGFSGTGIAAASEARLSNIVVTNTQKDLMVYLNVEGAFTGKMEKAVMNGVPITFSFFVTLNKLRDYWFNKEMEDLKITHTLKYHNLKKEFAVKRSWEEGKPLIVKTFAEARELMTEIAGLKVAELGELRKGRQYRITAKAELSKVTLPFYLHHILFFVSLWDFETDWYTIDFTY